MAGQRIYWPKWMTIEDAARLWVHQRLTVLRARPPKMVEVAPIIFWPVRYFWRVVWWFQYRKRRRS